MSRSAEPPANRRILRAVLLGAVGLGGAIIVASTLTASRATPSASALSSPTVATTAPVQTASAIAARHTALSTGEAIIVRRGFVTSRGDLDDGHKKIRRNGAVMGGRH
jgi:hypothetical protein